MIADRYGAIFLASTVLCLIVFIGAATLSYHQGTQTTNAAARVVTASSSTDATKILSRMMEDSIQKLIEQYENTENIDIKKFSENKYYKKLDTQMRYLFDDTRVLKAKVFGEDQSILYSTDYEEVLQNDEFDNNDENVIHALRGRVSSMIESKDSIKSFDGFKKNVSTVSSYHPIINSLGETIGVLEIYIDVTGDTKQLESINKNNFSILLIFMTIIPLSALLQLFLFFAYRKEKI